MTFNNLIQMIVKIREIALFTRATPGSSLVLTISTNKKVLCGPITASTFLTALYRA